MKKTYTRRTPEQMIADLEAKIEKVKARAASNEIRQSDEGKAFLGAVKAIDKALNVVTDEKMVRALEAGRAPLSQQLIEMGVRVSRNGSTCEDAARDRRPVPCSDPGRRRSRREILPRQRWPDPSGPAAAR